MYLFQTYLAPCSSLDAAATSRDHKPRRSEDQAKPFCSGALLITEAGELSSPRLSRLLVGAQSASSAWVRIEIRRGSQVGADRQLFGFGFSQLGLTLGTD